MGEEVDVLVDRVFHFPIQGVESDGLVLVEVDAYFAGSSCHAVLGFGAGSYFVVKVLGGFFGDDCFGFGSLGDTDCSDGTAALSERGLGVVTFNFGSGFLLPLLTSDEGEVGPLGDLEETLVCLEGI